MDKQQADSYVKRLLVDVNCNFKDTTVYIQTCIEYDFGWYFDYGVRGEPIYGGPDHGRFVSKEGFSYALHYVGFPRDIGIGDHMVNQQTLVETNGVFHPSKYAVRYFKKKIKVWKAIKENNNILNKTFNTEQGYRITDACKWLKCDLCMTQEKALEWIGINACTNLNHMETGYNRPFFDQVTSEWSKLTNEGLLDENWQSYYDKAIV
jgi:hypothetical protein